MILIKAVNRPPEVFDFDGAPLVKPLATNPYVLNSVKLYLIFVGPNWYQNNSPTTFVHDMSGRAEEILNSAYLKGLRQYGSDGIATYTDFYVDVGLDPVVWSMDYVLPNGQIVHSTNPDFFETNQILENSLFPSWQPGGGDARNSPIYVVVRYTQNGSNGGGGYGGSNDFGPNPPFTSLPINVIDVALTTADQVDQFTWVFSHEVVERISTGIGNQSTTGVFEITPDAGGQIADGEPEGPGFYAWRLNGSEGPLVTSYWSVVDQAYIVPDGGARVLLDPIWNGGSFAGLASLQQASLFLYQNSGNAVRTLIDTKVASYAIISAGSTARIFDLTVDRQVKAYGGSGTNWNVISATNMTAFALTATSDGNLYALANTHFRGASSGWRYGGSGTNWTTITPSNMSVTSMVSAGPKLYALGITARHSQVWEYSGTGTNWTPITTPPT